MSTARTETEWKGIAGGEVSVPVKATVQIEEREEQRTEAAPGRLLRLRVKVRRATLLPPGFVSDPPDAIARMTGEVVAGLGEGFFVAPGGGIVVPTDATPRGFFAGAILSSPPGGRHISDGEFYAALADAIERQVFTAAEAEKLCGDPRALKALRQGACQHVLAWVAALPDAGAFYAAAAKAGVPPGFGGRASGAADFAEYLALHAARLSAPELLALPGEIANLAA